MVSSAGGCCGKMTLQMIAGLETIPHKVRFTYDTCVYNEHEPSERDIAIRTQTMLFESPYVGL